MCTARAGGSDGGWTWDRYLPPWFTMETAVRNVLRIKQNVKVCIWGETEPLTVISNIIHQQWSGYLEQKCYEGYEIFKKSSMRHCLATGHEHRYYMMLSKSTEPMNHRGSVRKLHVERITAEVYSENEKKSSPTIASISQQPRSDWVGLQPCHGTSGQLS